MPCFNTMTDAYSDWFCIMWCWRRLLRVHWIARRSNQSILKDQSWIFIGRTDAEVKLWPPDVKNWLIGKDPDSGKDWRQEKLKTDDEMVGWHHRLDGHEFEEALGVGDGQGSLLCCSPWGYKSWTRLSDWTELKEEVFSMESKLTLPGYSSR